MIIKKLRPSRYLAGLAVIWGTIATLMGLVQNLGGLIACRLLLGVFEAGLFPGATLYLTMFYNRTHIAFRTALLLSTAAFAGSIGGLLAYAIGFMDGVAGLAAWRWIFILEGIFTVLLAGLVVWILPDSPETASFLTEEDRSNLERLRFQQVGQTASAQQFHVEDLKEGLTDWKIYVMAIGHWTTNLMFYSLSIFLPTIIRQIGKWSIPQVQALTIPVYATGAFTYIAVAYTSDRLQQRGIFAASFFAISVIGYGLLLADLNVSSKFAATFLISIGTYTVVGIPIAWVVSNQPRYAKRAFASGLQLSCGNSAGIATPFLYSSSDAPRYRPGYSATIALLCLGSSIYVFMHLYYRRQNMIRARGDLDHTTEGMSQAEINEMGEKNPNFRYTI
jgi:MFS family permease